MKRIILGQRARQAFSMLLLAVSASWIFPVIYNLILGEAASAVLRSGCYALMILVLAGRLLMSRDTWYVQPYINSVPRVMGKKDAISYNDASAVYTITTDKEVEYQGICLTYGMSIDYLAMPGIANDTKQRGGTLITIGPDGSFGIEQIPYEKIQEKETYR